MKKFLAIMLVAIFLFFAGCRQIPGNLEISNGEDVTDVTPTDVPEENTQLPSHQYFESTSSPTESDLFNIFTDSNPVFKDNSININPMCVFYKDSYLYMVAYVTNGYNYKVFNIHDVSIRLSNNETVIAEAYFGTLDGVVIQPKSYIIWIFVFSQDGIKVQNADLSYLITESYCKNSY